MMGSLFSSCIKSKKESYPQEYVKCCESHEECRQIWPGISSENYKDEHNSKNYITF